MMLGHHLLFFGTLILSTVVYGKSSPKDLDVPQSGLKVYRLVDKTILPKKSETSKKSAKTFVYTIMVGNVSQQTLPEDELSETLPSNTVFAGLSDAPVWPVASSIQNFQVPSIGEGGFISFICPSLEPNHFAQLNVLLETKGNSTSPTDSGAVSASRLGLKDRALPLKEKLLVGPNPAQDLAQILFRLTENGTATLVLSSIDGETVRTVSLGELNSGDHSATLNLQGVARGIYQVTLLVNNSRYANFKLAVIK